MTRPPKSKAIERLRRTLDAIPELKQLQYDSPEVMEWKRDARIAINHTFVGETQHIDEFDGIFHSALIMDDLEEDYLEEFDTAAALLRSMIKEIDEYWPDDNQVQIPSSAQANDQPSSNKVFVIHGRDEGTKETVARFLTKLGLEPVILQEQVSRGRTIIEKFEYHANARFAVALLTPDDAGSLQGDKNKLKPRARQNVIFELGFFIGRLGREGVCALTKGDVEIPSDYAGVVYIPLDDFAGWKQKLFQELKGAGFEVDANRAFQA